MVQQLRSPSASYGSIPVAEPDNSIERLIVAQICGLWLLSLLY